MFCINCGTRMNLKHTEPVSGRDKPNPVYFYTCPLCGSGVRGTEKGLSERSRYVPRRRLDNFFPDPDDPKKES